MSLMYRKLAAVAAMLAAVALLSLVGFVTITQLIEAYGDGPPYYGMTTNMDKWDSPLPFLLMLDVPVLLIMFALVRFARRSGHR